MTNETLNQELLDFLHFSPTPFHAVANMAAMLDTAGFTSISESERWDIQTAGRYYVTRNDAAICAFIIGSTAPTETGFRMVGAHTDSPCLKLKPNPDLHRKSYYQLGVEVYGGALLNPWFDRDLSMAGRVSFIDQDDVLQSALVDFERPCAVIPSLAIHLDKDANNNRKINPQTDIIPILMQHQGNEKPDFHLTLLGELARTHVDLDVKEIIDYEIFLYDTQPPDFIGLNEDFIASARLDNLLSCYLGLRSLIDTEAHTSRLLICNDHEEVGSVSASGAQGSFLSSVLERISGSTEDMARMIHQSMLISTDNAHGIHPNYQNKHDEEHAPLLNKGPVIKLNANQRYASNSETSAIFRMLCKNANIPVQNFVTRNDIRCGSTIGPLTAAQIGVRTLDVGLPTLAMHSIRELAGCQDTHWLYQALCAFNQSHTL